MAFIVTTMNVKATSILRPNVINIFFRTLLIISDTQLVSFSRLAAAKINQEATKFLLTTQKNLEGEF